MDTCQSPVAASETSMRIVRIDPAIQSSSPEVAWEVDRQFRMHPAVVTTLLREQVEINREIFHCRLSGAPIGRAAENVRVQPVQLAATNSDLPDRDDWVFDSRLHGALSMAVDRQRLGSGLR